MRTSHQFGVAFPRQFNITLAGCPGFLLKGMQHINGFREASLPEQMRKASSSSA
jgi:hypothetical protein